VAYLQDVWVVKEEHAGPECCCAAMAAALMPCLIWELLALQMNNTSNELPDLSPSHQPPSYRLMRPSAKFALAISIYNCRYLVKIFSAQIGNLP